VSGARPQQLRLLIAQQAARMMAEGGAQDYAFAKRKAARQLGATDDRCLPTNAEVEQALKLHHEIFHSDEQPHHLHELRVEALAVMRRFERFNPHLAGTVLDGTAGRYAEIEIHLFADSLKDVELFLLNTHIEYQMEEKPWRFGSERRRLPVFALTGEHGTIRLCVFETDDLRSAPRSASGNGSAIRAPLQNVVAMVEEATTAT
jgi:hypothetical protein